MDPDLSGSFDLGAVSISNAVVYAGSMSGHMYALHGATGAILKDIQGAGSSHAGPAIANDGTICWGPTASLRHPATFTAPGTGLTHSGHPLSQIYDRLLARPPVTQSPCATIDSRW